MRKRIRILGTVQGVGFRPFVYNLARSLDISGFVRNSETGVEIEAEGARMDSFLQQLRAGAPPLARIDEIAVADLEPRHETGFSIRESASPAGELGLVPPDIATCEECLRDIAEPGNRRFRYPFTNCTNCGPRYTIIRDVPYDRATTTMAAFRMCAACGAEYHNPADRRFHAQPNACPVCGPQISHSFEEVRGWLAAGAIVAIKGLGGYHLSCDARQDDAVLLLRQRKRRGNKPFAIMARSLDDAARLAVLGPLEIELLTSPCHPIVLAPRRDESGISLAIAPGNPDLGVMLPYTPLHHLLFAGGDFPALVMTSGNLSEEPIVSREDELPRLAGLADRFLTHNRPIGTAVDDSVVRVFRGRPLVMRRSRGYAPVPIDLGYPVRDLVAAGGELKNTFCITTGHYAIPSQHIGDLENYETLVFFRQTLEHMLRFFRVRPEAVAHDLHPGYLSTRAAAEMGLPLVGVQHHHAHIASCMAENRLSGRVIGVALDGTGYGPDGAIWGGEVLECGLADFERHYHLRYVPMAGGDAAARQPWRMALAYLRDAGLSWDDPPDVFHLAAVDRMIARGIQTVPTSSCGRLFDAVSALLGVCMENRYEAEAAMELEAVAGSLGPGEHPFSFELTGDEIDLRQAIREIAAEHRAGYPAANIAARFHATLAEAIGAACSHVRAASGLARVCLSGGSFQNRLLLEATTQTLERTGFNVYLHSEIPPNDGGLAVGQVVVAAARLG
jgi:hydrogenase maturation protein HypF